MYRWRHSTILVSSRTASAVLLARARSDTGEPSSVVDLSQTSGKPAASSRSDESDAEGEQQMSGAVRDDDQGGVGEEGGDPEPQGSEIGPVLPMGIDDPGGGEAQRIAASPSTQPDKDASLSAMLKAPLQMSEADLVASWISGSYSAAPVRKLNKYHTILTVADLRMLHGVSRQNDGIVNSFAALFNDRYMVERSLRCVQILERAQTRGGNATVAVQRTFIFGTYFYARLSERAGVYDYEGVRGWGKKGRLLLNALDLILAPIHVNRAHWVLAGINVRERRFLSYDSFGEDYETIIPMLRCWLHDDAMELLGASAADFSGVAAWPLIWTVADLF